VTCPGISDFIYMLEKEFEKNYYDLGMCIKESHLHPYKTDDCLAFY